MVNFYPKIDGICPKITLFDIIFCVHFLVLFEFVTDNVYIKCLVWQFTINIIIVMLQYFAVISRSEQ